MYSQNFGAKIQIFKFRVFARKFKLRFKYFTTQIFGANLQKKNRVLEFNFGAKIQILDFMIFCAKIQTKIQILDITDFWRENSHFQILAHFARFIKSGKEQVTKSKIFLFLGLLRAFVY